MHWSYSTLLLLIAPLWISCKHQEPSPPESDSSPTTATTTQTLEEAAGIFYYSGSSQIFHLIPRTDNEKFELAKTQAAKQVRFTEVLEAGPSAPKAKDFQAKSILKEQAKVDPKVAETITKEIAQDSRGEKSFSSIAKPRSYRLFRSTTNPDFQFGVVHEEITETFRKGLIQAYFRNEDAILVKKDKLKAVQKKLLDYAGQLDSLALQRKRTTKAQNKARIQQEYKDLEARYDKLEQQEAALLTVVNNSKKEFQALSHGGERTVLHRQLKFLIQDIRAIPTLRPGKKYHIVMEALHGAQPSNIETATQILKQYKDKFSNVQVKQIPVPQAPPAAPAAMVLIEFSLKTSSN
ncbi:MAG: hypothetical protein OXT67_11645 [Zetaproteobacteria bacterium]|nr:hypothetical protein [Zetaproteobacteria bacterium]